MKYFLILCFLIFPLSAHAKQGPNKDNLLTVDQLTRSHHEGGVFQLLQWSKDHTLFVSALLLTGLNEELDKNNSWTVMAPTNRAFSKLPREKVHELFAPENREKLKHLMKYHLQKGGLLLTDSLPVGSSRYTTFNGNDIVITKDYRGVLLNGSYLIAADLKARNGVVHFVDRLISP
ncbi:MAG: hypothetical protein COB76_03910 [Alphaproteobacteria bacterium]|nr:MAG: hypothetical protein COB76_03910 [Alphaproteobacteria bacterium]